jgi:hypothetical protein
MYYTITTPPASRAADRPPQIDEALVAEARRALHAVVVDLPPAASLTRGASQSLFAIPMARLHAETLARGVPIEKLIVAIKLAWSSLPESRLRLGDGASEVLAGAVTACIEAYFAPTPLERRRAD